ncbi:hypothetical protein [Maricaulis sp.]|uniref:hypothetical protein n=1 Tax=Maricaulis sp. TaxID=1486257 RepID=UPI00262B5204|nr:hypothetical protein [Maricaulis sp.]
MSNSVQSSGADLAPRAGGLLAASAVLVIFVMGHHPAGHGHGEGISLSHIVHGAMIVLLVTQLWALSVFTLVRAGDGWRLAGLVFFAMATVAQLIAGTMNGFVVAELAGHGTELVPQGVFTALWEINQGFAGVGIALAGLGLVLWGAGLIRQGGRLALLAGLALIASGAVSAGALLFGVIALDIAGAFIAYGLQAAGLLVLGLALWRRAI